MTRNSVRLFLFPLLVLSFPGSATAASFISFHCDGFAVEAGQKRLLTSTEPFHTLDADAALAETSLNFKFSRQRRMTLQVRALKTARGLQVATTFLELFTDPLGKVASAFYEKVFASGPNGAFIVDKHFPELQLSLACKPQS
jgi:hypothetical protein